MMWRRLVLTATLTLLALAGLVSGAPLVVDDTTASTAPPQQAAPSTDFPAVRVPPGIDGDCSTNVTGALNAWIASVPDRSTLTLTADACYRVDYTLNLTDRHDLTIDGRGARFEARTTFPRSPKVTRPMINILGGSNITVRDLTLKGTNPSPTYDGAREWFAGLRFQGVDGGLVTDVTASNLWGDFVYLGADGRGQGPEPHTSNLTVSHSSSTTVGRNQVTCTACEDVLVTQNTFTGTGYQVFDIEVQAPGWHASDVAFTDNTIGGRVPLSVLVNAGIGDYVRDITFVANTMVSTPTSCESPIFVLDTEPEKSNFVITGNHLRTLGAAVRVAGVSNVTLEDNLVQLAYGGGCAEPGTAVRAVASTGTIKRNHFAGFSRILAAGGPPVGTVCSNRLNGPIFDRPVVCSPSRAGGADVD